ncbi:hypothetical protein ABZW18_00135 [Streptomyces sp. NPDC004647]|uniref:hypothetical protein n=1 Tax=Streptomyces sp. NPDC004647 TaxID=3154671 RepID=UPI0033AC32F8
MAGHLKPVDGLNVVGEAAVLRATLWQYLREQTDRGQLKAIDDGRAAGLPWHHFIQPLCVSTKHGAYQKARRLAAEQLREPYERRSPEVAREHEDRRVAEERAERLRVSAQERRFPIAQRITRQLLQHRDGLVVAGMAAYWLDELSETADDRQTPLERANFSDFLEAFVRAIHQLARERKQPATTTEGAHQALARATDFLHQELPDRTDCSQRHKV